MNFCTGVFAKHWICLQLHFQIHTSFKIWNSGNIIEELLTKFHSHFRPSLRGQLPSATKVSSSVHGNSQARILEWVAISFLRESSQPRDWTPVSCTAGRFFTIWATREAHYPKVIWVLSSEFQFLGKFFLVVLFVPKHWPFFPRNSCCENWRADGAVEAGSSFSFFLVGVTCRH